MIQDSHRIHHIGYQGTAKPKACGGRAGLPETSSSQSRTRTNISPSNLASGSPLLHLKHPKLRHGAQLHQVDCLELGERDFAEHLSICRHQIQGVTHRRPRTTTKPISCDIWMLYEYRSNADNLGHVYLSTACLWAYCFPGYVRASHFFMRGQTLSPLDLLIQENTNQFRPV